MYGHTRSGGFRSEPRGLPPIFMAILVSLIRLGGSPAGFLRSSASSRSLVEIPLFVSDKLGIPFLREE